MKKGHFWGIITVLILLAIVQQILLQLQGGENVSSAQYATSGEGSTEHQVKALGQPYRDRSHVYNYVRTFDTTEETTRRAPSEALRDLANANGSAMPWMEEAEDAIEATQYCEAANTLIEGMQVDRTYLCFLIDDIDTLVFPLISHMLETDCADNVVDLISATVVASGDPIAYLRNLLVRMPEEEIAAIWPQDPYVYITKFESESALENAQTALDLQDRRNLDFELTEEAAEANDTALLIDTGEPQRDGPLLAGWKEPFLNISPGESGVRVYTDSQLPETIEVALDMQGEMGNGQLINQALRITLPEPLNSGMLLFDSAELGDSLFDNAIMTFGRSMPWLMQGVEHEEVKNTGLNMTFVGLDIPPATENQYYIDRIELYVPYDSWHAEPTVPNPSEYQLYMEMATNNDDAQVDREQMDRLQAIGYLGAVSEAPSESGVVTHDPEAAQPGYNFFQSSHSDELYLMDMEGTIVHTWKPKLDTSALQDINWRRARLYPNGDVLALQSDTILCKMDKDGNILWQKQEGYHHDMRIAENGNIYVLYRQLERNPLAGPEGRTLVDYVAILSPEGELIRRVSVLEALEDSGYAPQLRKANYTGDILHTNSIMVLDGQLSDTIPAFKAGNVLVCIPKFDFIAIIDMEEEKIVWGLNGKWAFPHDPKLLPNDNMLIFDNFGPAWQRLMYPSSSVIEFNPITQEVAWEFTGSRDNPFYSRTCGAASMLPNENILITETNNGRIIEVDRNNEIVWEYINPMRAGEDEELIPVIFEMSRHSEEYVEDWLPR